VTDIFGQKVFARLRRLCLAFPETAETTSWGHPNFRAGEKTFCAFEIIGGRPSIAFRLAPGDVERTSRRKHFFATPYGRGLWVSRWVDVGLDWGVVATLLEQSYRLVANKRILASFIPRRKQSRSVVPSNDELTKRGSRVGAKGRASRPRAIGRH
jgi:predicted DNA-binding protein (MmcQ/YjbR family)